MGNLSKNAYANELMTRGKEINERENLGLTFTYDEKEFSITTQYPDPDQKSILNLHNMYDFFAGSTDDKTRNRNLGSALRFILGRFNLPDTFEEMEPDILPKAYHIFYMYRERYEAQLAGLDRNRDVDMDIEAFIDATCVKVTDTLVIRPVYDGADFMTPIPLSKMQEFGKTVKELLEIGIRNLRKIEVPVAVAQNNGDNLYFLSSDHYNSSRFLLENLMSVPVTGDPVVGIPDRDTLMLVGDKSANGLEAMLNCINDKQKSSYRVSSVPIRFVDGAWHDWIPDVTPELQNGFKAAAREQERKLYAFQADYLNEIHDNKKIDIFVSPIFVLTDKNKNEKSMSLTVKEINEVWFPRVDMLSFVTDPGAEQRQGIPSPKTLKIVTLEWPVLMEHFGDHISQVEGTYPKRYKVTHYPDWEQLEKHQTAQSREMQDKMAAIFSN